MSDYRKRTRPQPVRGMDKARIAIVAGRFNAAVVDRLIEGARMTLSRHGVTDAAQMLLHVPGAFELPLAARELALAGEVDAVVALGAVIRGETAHFEYVCSECAGGLMRVSLDYGLPIGFGVITADTEAQAQARAGDEDNKGIEAAEAALEMIGLLRELRR